MKINNVTFTIQQTQFRKTAVLSHSSENARTIVPTISVQDTIEIACTKAIPFAYLHQQVSEPKAFRPQISFALSLNFASAHQIFFASTITNLGGQPTARGNFESYLGKRSGSEACRSRSIHFHGSTTNVEDEVTAGFKIQVLSQFHLFMITNHSTCDIAQTRHYKCLRRRTHPYFCMPRAIKHETNMSNPC